MTRINLVSKPIVVPIAEMVLNPDGVLQMADWVRDRRPHCTPEGGYRSIVDLLPHNGSEEHWTEHGDGRRTSVFRSLTDNEILVELAGRKCYDSFAEKAGKKTNGTYLQNLTAGTVPHRSVFYHAKMSFFVAQVSRRVSHELIRNYVGADRDEEGNPSQESTRFTEHYGSYIIPPKILEDEIEVQNFRNVMQHGYNEYLNFIERQVERFKEHRFGQEPKGMDRKRIYEAASFYLHHSVETSFIWTTNPMALAKLFLERCDEGADAEFQRFAKIWRELCLNRWPNLFPKPPVVAK